MVIVTKSTFEGLRRGDGMTTATVPLRPRVQALQERLTAVGSPCSADGRFGPLTTQALNTFQTSRGIPPSEQVDVVTADALEGRGPDLNVHRVCADGDIPIVVA